MSLGRTLVIGDVHGCLSELDALLALLAPRLGDQLVFLGDLVDRGPDSLGVVRRVRELLSSFPGSVALCGNHEHKALRRWARGEAGRGWAAEAADEDRDFLASMPLIARLPRHGVVAVHGGFYPAFFEHHGPLGEVPATWRTDGGKLAERRRRFLFVRGVDAAGNMQAVDEHDPVDRHWTEAYDGREGLAFFGHDPQLAPPVPLVTPHAIGLDTGCCFGGRLTAAVLEAGAAGREARFVSVPGGSYAPVRHASPA